MTTEVAGSLASAPTGAAMVNHVSNALHQRRTGNTGPYRQLIQHLRTESDPAVLCGLLEALSLCVSSISPQTYELVEAVLGMQWVRYYADEAFVAAYFDFTESLLSAHAPFAVACIKVAVATLSFAPGSSVRDTLGEACPESALASAFGQVHVFLSTVLRVVPTSMQSLMPLLTEAFPHKRLDMASHVWYTRNILLIAGYAPAMISDIIALIVERIIQLDVEIQIDLDELNGSNQGVGESSFLIMDGMDAEDLGGASFGSEQEHYRKLVEKLDNVMFIMFEFLQKKCLENDMVNPNDVLLMLLPSFERIVMTTSRSKYTQYLYFYFVCAAPKHIGEQFLSFLMHILFDPNKSVLMRQSAASYVASLLSRGRPFALSSVRLCLRLFSQWLNSYLDHFESGSGSSDADWTPSRHVLFYYVAQAVFYITCFRSNQLFSRSRDDDDDDVTDGLEFMSSLGLDRVVNCRLNPLRVCIPSVVKEFASVMHTYQIVYCYAALQRTTSSSNGSAPPTPTSTPSHAMFVGIRETIDFESFFAFEPMALSQCSRFVAPFYQEWGTGDDAAADAGGHVQPEMRDYDDVMAGAETAVSTPGRAIPTAAGRGAARDEDEDELGGLVLSPESVEMDFMFAIRSPRGAAAVSMRGRAVRGGAAARRR